ASRSVPVASEFMSPQTREAAKARFKSEYEKMRADHERRKEDKHYISLADARRNKTAIDWDEEHIVTPSFLGNKVLLDFPLETIRKYIDWTPFFQTWMLAGRFPGILKDPVVGEEATRVYNDAQVMLDKIIADKSLQANGVIGFYPAVSTGTDDVQLYSANGSGEKMEVIHFLRQQNKKAKNLPNFCFSDFIAPETSGKRDYLGMFAVTAG